MIADLVMAFLGGIAITMLIQSVSGILQVNTKTTKADKELFVSKMIVFLILVLVIAILGIGRYFLALDYGG